MRFFSICSNSTSTKYGQPDMSILKTSSGCRKLRQRSFLSKHEFKLIHRGGRVIDTLRQHSRDINAYQHRIIVS